MSLLPDVEGLPLGAMTTIVVAAALIERGGRFLITRRQQGVHLEGLWEFPGGKCDTGESHQACLARELREELDVISSVGEQIFETTHTYPELHVELHFYSCELLSEPAPQLGQEMRWASREELAELKFPAADAELIERLVKKV
jgi:mutator protein MutT